MTKKLSYEELEKKNNELENRIIKVEKEKTDKLLELEAIYKNSPLMMCILDENQKIIYANKNIQDFMGKEYEDILNFRACGAFGCKNAKEDIRGCGYGISCKKCELNLAIQSTIETGKSHQKIKYFATLENSGSQKNVILTGYTSLIAVSNHKYISLILVDDSERYKIEEKMKENEIMLNEAKEIAENMLFISEQLFENDVNAIFWTDEEGYIVKANIAAAQLFECSRTELIGMHYLELHPDNIKEAMKKSFEDAVENINITNVAVDIITKTGIIKNVIIYPTTIKINNQLIHQGIFVDITEKKNTEFQIKLQNEQLKELNATKDKFFAIISHDLKGPIASGVHLLKCLIDELEKISKENLLELMTGIKSSFENINELLENLLNWAMMQKGGIDFEPKDTDTDAIIMHCIKLLLPVAEKKKIQIIYDKNRGVPLFVDKQMISTVVRNIISNAIKFTNEEGKVTIEVIKNNSDVEIRIIDTGIGITGEKISRLFKLSEKVTTIGTNDEYGTGLGLIVSKEFVEKNGGRIRVESLDGVGSTFTIVLPQKNGGT